MTKAAEEELHRASETAVVAAGGGAGQKISLAIRVTKSNSIWGKSGRLGRNMAKPRVLALTTAYPSKGQRTKALLHVLKYSSGGVLEPAKLYKLKHLTKVEVVPNDPTGCTFMLGFDNLGSQSVAPPQWTMRNIDDRNRLLICILNMCKGITGHMPKVVGIDIVEMALWAKVSVSLSEIHKCVIMRMYLHTWPKRILSPSQNTRGRASVLIAGDKSDRGFC